MPAGRAPAGKEPGGKGPARRAPARGVNTQRLRAAVDEQRAALGEPAWAGPSEAEGLGRECVRAVLAATDAGLVPGKEALRGAVTYLLGVLAGRAPGRAVEVRVPPYAAVQVIEGPRPGRLGGGGGHRKGPRQRAPGRPVGLAAAAAGLTVAGAGRPRRSLRPLDWRRGQARWPADR